MSKKQYWAFHVDGEWSNAYQNQQHNDLYFTEEEAREYATNLVKGGAKTISAAFYTVKNASGGGTCGLVYPPTTAYHKSCWLEV